MKLKISKGIPQKTVLKALEIVGLIDGGEHVPYTKIKMRNTGYKSIKVGLYYRLLIVDTNRALLLHHEEYTKKLGR